MIELKLGERYRAENGGIVDDLGFNESLDTLYLFYSKKHDTSWTKDGKRFTFRDDGLDIIEHLPKEEKMQDQPEPKVEITTKAGKVVLSLDDAIEVGEAAKQKKAEIAKREEIQEGDWCQTGSKLFKCTEIKGNYAQSKNKDSYYLGCCKKLHPTPEVKAWLDGVVGAA
jgi:hypothetical protein